MSGKDVRLDRLMDLAEKWYSKKKFSHAMRVAGYANAMAMHDDRVDPLDAYVVAIAHDLIEDTNEFNIGCNGRPAKLYRFKDDIKEIDIF